MEKNYNAHICILILELDKCTFNVVHGRTCFNTRSVI